MKLLKIIFLILVTALIIWIDFPENLQIKFRLGKKDINFKINPLSIDVQIFGTRVKKSFKTQLGLDLKGGSHLVFEADTTKVKTEDLQDALSSVRDIIERRVNLYGVSEPVVQMLKSEGNHRVSVDLPGISNISEAVNLIGQTAQLSFKEELITKEKEATQTPIFLRLNKETGLTGKHVKKAGVVFDPNDGKPQVSLNFSDAGAKLFGEITERNINKPVGIFIDQLLISAPTVQQAITGGEAVITGDF